MSVEEIISASRTLSREDQARLVNSLLESIHQANPTIDHAWSDEISRRKDEMLSGKAKTVPGDEVKAKLRRQFRRE